MLRLPLVVVAVIAAWLAPAQDPRPDAAELQRAQQAAQVGPEHALLQRLVGAWDVEVRTEVDGQRRTDRGRMQAAAILGGRYVQLDFALALGDAKVEARQLLGFDALRQQFTSSWRDSASTWSIEAAGAPSPAWRDGVALRGLLVDAREPAGKPFRLELDLGDLDRVAVRMLVGDGAAAREVQAQTWTRR